MWKYCAFFYRAVREERNYGVTRSKRNNVSTFVFRFKHRLLHPELIYIKNGSIFTIPSVGPQIQRPE